MQEPSLTLNSSFPGPTLGHRNLLKVFMTSSFICYQMFILLERNTLGSSHLALSSDYLTPLTDKHLDDAHRTSQHRGYVNPDRICYSFKCFPVLSFLPSLPYWSTLHEQKQDNADPDSVPNKDKFSSCKMYQSFQSSILRFAGRCT